MSVLSLSGRKIILREGGLGTQTFVGSLIYLVDLLILFELIFVK